jgi:hypothetical protein
MTRWMDEKIEMIKIADGYRAKQLRIHKDEVIKLHATALWGELCDMIKEDVQKYNDAFQNGETTNIRLQFKQEMENGNEFIVESTLFLSKSDLVVRFNGTCIDYEYRGWVSPVYYTEGKKGGIILEVNGQDEILFKHKDCLLVLDQVIGLLLNPLLPSTELH